MLPFTLRFSTSFIAFPFLLAEKFPQRAENVGQSKKSSVHIFLQCTIKTMSTSSTQFLTWSTSAYFFQVRKEARSRNIVQITLWLCSWCCKKGFGFYDNGLCFNDCSLIEKDGQENLWQQASQFGEIGFKMKGSEGEVPSGNDFAISSSWAVGHFSQCGNRCSLIASQE